MKNRWWKSGQPWIWITAGALALVAVADFRYRFDGVTHVCFCHTIWRSGSRLFA